MWKLLIWLLLRRDLSLVKGVKVRGISYLVTIEEYISANQQMEKWESALKEDINQST